MIMHACVPVSVRVRVCEPLLLFAVSQTELQFLPSGMPLSFSQEVQQDCFF